jgi:hypothetical protein
VRLATLIISLVLTLVVGFQSCAALLGGGMGEEFGETAKEKAEGKELSDASGAGLVAGIFWVVGAGLVMARPGIARWFYLAAAPLLLLAGVGGYEDGYIWAVVSLIFMAMAWRGIKERERKEAERQEGQFAQFEQWQQQQGRQPPGSPPPQAGGS